MDVRFGSKGDVFRHIIRLDHKRRLREMPITQLLVVGVLEMIHLIAKGQTLKDQAKGKGLERDKRSALRVNQMGRKSKVRKNKPERDTNRSNPTMRSGGKSRQGYGITMSLKVRSSATGVGVRILTD